MIISNTVVIRLHIVLITGTILSFKFLSNSVHAMKLLPFCYPVLITTLQYIVSSGTFWYIKNAFSEEEKGPLDHQPGWILRVHANQSG